MRLGISLRRSQVRGEKSGSPTRLATGRDRTTGTRITASGAGGNSRTGAGRAGTASVESVPHPVPRKAGKRKRRGNNNVFFERLTKYFPACDTGSRLLPRRWSSCFFRRVGRF